MSSDSETWWNYDCGEKFTDVWDFKRFIVIICFFQGEMIKQFNDFKSNQWAHKFEFIVIIL